MNPKETLLQSIREALANQTITEDDLASFISPKLVTSEIVDESHIGSRSAASAPNKKLSVVDVLFYLAGLVLYAALMVMAFQAGSGSPMLQIGITLGTGLAIWTVTYILGTQPNQTDTRKGLVNSLMLSGSLAVSSGGFIVAYQIAGTAAAGLTFAIAITMVLLGSFHLLFDRIFRHIILIVLGVLLACAAFPTLIIALLSNMSVSPDVWALIGVSTGLVVGFSGRLAARTGPDRGYLKNAFESLAGFIVLGSIYAAGLSSSIAPLWEIILPLTIYLAFYISIKQRSKNFLITGSFFLVVFLITVSFKYFSGLGVAFSLILSALSILATAFMAAKINKRYIKYPQQ